jgi:hypothetical protein
MSGTYYPGVRQQLVAEAFWLAHTDKLAEDELLIEELADHMAAPRRRRDERLLRLFYDELEPSWDD